MNNRTRNNNNANWNNTNQNVRNNPISISNNESDNQTIHKLNPNSNFNQQPAQNLKSIQSEFLNEIEILDYDKLNFKDDSENQKENKLSTEEIDSIIKTGQTKVTLNTLANKMMEDLRGKSEK
jgi:hypothetical protein